VTQETEEKTYYRKGLGLKDEVKPVLESEYGSALVSAMKEGEHRLDAGRLRFRLAESFGFCYGVDRAVEYAYEAREKFPDRDIYLVGEIIHNPHVNRQLREMEITFLYPDDDGRFDFSMVGGDDVVIVPAFGVALDDFERLKEKECVVVDTTCGSVLLVWKRVESYAEDGFTAVIHGKHYHEETRATSSRVHKWEDGKFLIVRDMSEAERVCDYIRGEGDREEFLEFFEGKHSEGFDPDEDLGRVGMANQTTMVASESLAIADRLEEAMVDRYGEEEAEDRFRSFDTICSATQDRQDAVNEMMEDPPDVMVVIGGYNSSNTNHLAYICSQSVPTYHIEDATCVDPATGELSHKEIMGEERLTSDDWLPEGDVEVGLTAGASTPDSKIGETVERILRADGLDPDEVLSEAMGRRLPQAG
jgi:4-hydroxy-3-methylbut-2-enyl diphosphate reductase